MSTPFGKKIPIWPYFGEVVTGALVWSVGEGVSLLPPVRSGRN